MSDVKEAVHTVLLRYYNQYGLDQMKEIARVSLGKRINGNKKIDSKTFHTSYNGEVCETVLECIIVDWMKRHPEKTANWYLNKSLILADRDNLKSNFLTEIDLLLMTPQCVYVFECKSYAGKKYLYPDGRLARESGNSCNVLRQNCLHLEVLKKWMDKLSSNPVYQMVLFDFSKGELVDYRDRDDRLSLRYTDDLNVISMIRENERGEQVWSPEILEKVHNVFNGQSDDARERHLKYVKSLKEKDNE